MPVQEQNTTQAKGSQKTITERDHQCYESNFKISRHRHVNDVRNNNTLKPQLKYCIKSFHSIQSLIGAGSIPAAAGGFYYSILFLRNKTREDLEFPSVVEPSRL